ncbi:MAG: hypothetical protein ABH869_03670 [Candidatus Omnitrophota bacterium]
MIYPKALCAKGQIAKYQPINIYAQVSSGIYGRNMIYADRYFMILGGSIKIISHLNLIVYLALFRKNVKNSSGLTLATEVS